MTQPSKATAAKADSRGAADGPGGIKGLLKRIGWKAPVTVVAIMLAGVLIYRTLGQYSYDELVSSVQSVPVNRLLAAAGFAAASYLCLTGFDYLALRYVKKPLAYPKVALASFISLSLGHNIGLAAASSGAVRYRFYSRWGLSAAEVGKLIVFCALTVGLGLLLLGGSALILQTEMAAEITGLGQSILMLIGVACVGIVLAYLAVAAWVTRPVRFRRWSLEIPPLRLALPQVAIGAINFAFVAACLHQTLAAVADVGYFSVASIYVIANTTAIFSHVPGGLGVIESVVMYLLPGANLIGSLLVFRFIYFLAPLALGATAFLLAEATFRMSGRSHTRSARGV